MSSTAKTSSPSRATATSWSPSVDAEGLVRRGPRRARRRARSAIAQPTSLQDVLGELGLDGGEQLLLELGHADLADQVVEEAVHDQAARLVLGDAARAQVEQLLVVEAAGRRRVAGALDLAGLDLEVRAPSRPGSRR